MMMHNYASPHHLRGHATERLGSFLQEILMQQILKDLDD